MATDINGAKIHINMDSNIEPGKMSDEAWRDKLKNLKEVTLNSFALVEGGIMDIPLSRHSVEYYMRRGNRYYFRGVGFKIMAYIEDASVMAGAKYHETFYVEMGPFQEEGEPMPKLIQEVIDQVNEETNSIEKP